MLWKALLCRVVRKVRPLFTVYRIAGFSRVTLILRVLEMAGNIIETTRPPILGWYSESIGDYAELTCLRHWMESMKRMTWLVQEETKKQINGISVNQFIVDSLSQMLRLSIATNTKFACLALTKDGLFPAYIFYN